MTTTNTELVERLAELRSAMRARSSKVVGCDGNGRAYVMVRFNSLAAAHRFDMALTAALNAGVEEG
jgi:hypothetical protein